MQFDPAIVVPEAAIALDALHPNWARRINREKLKMNDVCHCIFGQLRWVHAGEFVGVANHEARKFSIHMGVTQFDNPGTAVALRDAWLREIDKRLLVTASVKAEGQEVPPGEA